LQATSLLGALTGELGRRLLAASGFRDANGIPGAVLTLQAGIDHSTITPQKPDAAALRKATSALATVRRGSRLLALIDVSGSMSSSVPGARGATRLDLALASLTTGLAVYPDDTVAGLWTFSTNLTATTDYRALVQPVVLGTGPDGTSGRARLAQSLAGVRVKPNGDTGLYDSVLAAVRMMRRTWDPERVNSVVVVTDGANDDPSGISLATLLRTLAAERDANRPVRVFAIAYGPSADVVPLRQITAAAGGTVYVARDPRTISSVLQDAIGRRVCATSCS
jgi:Mg-chelatase subunit ChlD